jgi:hypothetical protein
VSLTFDNTSYQLLQMTTKYPTEVEDDAGNSGYPVLVVDITEQTITSQLYSEKTRLKYFIEMSDKDHIKPSARFKGYKIQSLLE